MKILKYKKEKNNIYKVYTDKSEYQLYDDIIIKYELLLKKEINEKEFKKIEEENNLLKAYYDALKSINTKMRSEKEIRTILQKKNYSEKEINHTISKLKENNYLKASVYIDAYIHDRLTIYLEGEDKILKDLISLGFSEQTILPFLKKVDRNLYKEKIEKYINKKVKSNKKSSFEFKRKIMGELLNKGFNKNDIAEYLEKIEIEDNIDEIAKLINKLYKKYITKYDLYTTKNKIKAYLYSKGYTNINIDSYLTNEEQ